MILKYLFDATKLIGVWAIIVLTNQLKTHLAAKQNAVDKNLN